MATAAVGDSVFWMLAKQVQALGGTASSTDTEFSLLAKLVVALGGTAISGDTVFWLLVKELRALGGTAISGDTVFWLLYKQVLALGGTTSSNDTVFSLLAKLTGLMRPVVSGPQSITPSGIPSTNAFGTATVAGGGVAQNLAPTGIASINLFGTATVGRGTIALAPTGIASTNAFGTAVVAYPTQNLAPSGIVSANAFGTAHVQYNLILGLSSQAANASPGQAGISSSQAVLSVTGTVKSMSILVGGAKTDSGLLGIYTDVGGVPTTLVATTAVIPISTSGVQWVTANVTGNPVLSPGTYWITGLFQSGTCPGFYANAGTSIWDTAFAWQTTLPTTYPTTNGGGPYQTSMYATLLV